MAETTAAARPSSPLYTEPSWIQVGDLEVAYRRKRIGRAVALPARRRWNADVAAVLRAPLAVASTSIAPEHPGFGDTEFPEWLDGFDDLVLHYRDFLDVLELEPRPPRRLLARRLDRGRPRDLLPRAAREPDADHAGRAPRPRGADGRTSSRCPRSRSRTCSSTATSCSTSTTCRIRRASTRSCTRSARWERSRGSPGRRATTRSSSGGCRASRCRRSWSAPRTTGSCPNEHADRWAELVPGARLERIPGTGHGLLMQEPDRTAELILGFIEGVNR